ncbi:MAG: hypothetical protein GF418_01410 [Chitinivibrionales bacterium]|nr:hypothetical protein [Chitinivibrionales bacterium]MBD3394260.1 hypothetical protein [Chitinivibrionales bacterium]
MLARTAMMTALVPAAIVLVAGCVATYSPPRIQREVVETTVDAGKRDIYRVSLHVLRKSGFRFAFADQTEGRITTRPKTLKLTNRECDCGAAMGRTFSSDSRTTTDVSYFIIARDGGFSLRSIIEGQYVASDTSMVKRFHCVSRGVLEKQLVDDIKDGLDELEESSAGAEEL